jgi:hypothetical protein
MRSWQTNRQLQRYATGCCLTCGQAARGESKQAALLLLLLLLRQPHVAGHLIGEVVSLLPAALQLAARGWHNAQLLLCEV